CTRTGRWGCGLFQWQSVRISQGDHGSWQLKQSDRLVPGTTQGMGTSLTSCLRTRASLPTQGAYSRPPGMNGLSLWSSSSCAHSYPDQRAALSSSSSRQKLVLQTMRTAQTSSSEEAPSSASEATKPCSWRRSGLTIRQGILCRRRCRAGNFRGNSRDKAPPPNRWLLRLTLPDLTTHTPARLNYAPPTQANLHAAVPGSLP
ncbi:hypothetical protein F5Y03DRAFT_411121, partial [Xylaria venustula]